MTPGQIVYHLYHQPVEYLTQVLRRGIGKTIALNRGKRKMMEAANRLWEIVYPDAQTFTVYFLTGKKYWYQTAFCLYSLQRQAGCNIHAVVVDDGSFDEGLMKAVRQQFPTTVSIVKAACIQQLLDEKLPVNTFPVLRSRRLEYPHLRKLTDVHILPGDGPKLVLDSDMLFFHRPTELIEWLQQPDGFLFMRDVEQSYGYTDALMRELTGIDQMPALLNVGVAGIASEKVDWQQLESWTKALLKREGSSYLQEQALTAMLATTHQYRFLDSNLYKVLPAINGDAVKECLHHYVAESKYDYFAKGWKKAMSSTHLIERKQKHQIEKVTV